MATYYVGLDVHLRHTTMCILDRHPRAYRPQVDLWQSSRADTSQLRSLAVVVLEHSTESLAAGDL